MKADTTTESGVKAAIAALANHYEKRNLDGFMAVFAADNDVTIYGTGVDEKRIGTAEIRAQVSRDWNQTEALAMRFGAVAVSSAGNVAWANTDGTLEIGAGGAAMHLPVRATFVLERRSGAWLIVQAHFSTPAAGQDAGASVPR